MPEISRFYGIVIQIFWDDHGPPHFHAKYADSEALFEIEDISMLRGDLPRRARELVIVWATQHRSALQEAWARAQRHEAPGKIEPLD